MLVVDLVDPAIEFFRIAQPANVVSDFSVVSALQTDNLLDPIAFGWRNALQSLRVKLVFYRLAYLVAQLVCRQCGERRRQSGKLIVTDVTKFSLPTAHDEQLTSLLRNVAFLKRII